MNTLNPILSESYFFDEDAAIKKLKGIVWPLGPICPSCKSLNDSYNYTKNPRRCKCKSCNKQFSLFSDTIFESSHLPIHKWLRAIQYIFLLKHTLTTYALAKCLNITRNGAKRIHRVLKEAAPELIAECSNNPPESFLESLEIREELSLDAILLILCNKKREESIWKV